MELLTSIAVAGAGALALLIVGCIIASLWWRDVESRPVFLEQLLRRQGDAVAHRALASGSREFAVAVQRCLACSEAAQCRAWLASGAREGYDAFCPNAGYIERMKQ